MEKKYICIRDYQDTNFAVGYNMTIEEWRETAMGWAECDDRDELYEELKTMPKDKIINFIADFWELEIIENISNLNVKNYEEDYYRLEFERFKDIQDLRRLINVNGKFKVKTIAPKKFYDNDFEDWCYNVVLLTSIGNEVADLTVWYAKARTNKIITGIEIEWL